MEQVQDREHPHTGCTQQHRWSGGCGELDADGVLLGSVRLLEDDASLSAQLKADADADAASANPIDPRFRLPANDHVMDCSAEQHDEWEKLPSAEELVEPPKSAEELDTLLHQVRSEGFLVVDTKPLNYRGLRDTREWRERMNKQFDEHKTTEAKQEPSDTDGCRLRLQAADEWRQRMNKQFDEQKAAETKQRPHRATNNVGRSQSLRP